jgi:hypothetical protein
MTYNMRVCVCKMYVMKLIGFLCSNYSIKKQKKKKKFKNN